MMENRESDEAIDDYEKRFNARHGIDQPPPAGGDEGDEGEDFAAVATDEEMKWIQRQVDARGVTLYPSREGGKLVLKNAKGVTLHTFGE